MKQELKKVFEQRRTCYNISNQSPISDKEIQEIIEITLTNTPSAFNSQSARIVLLLGDQHKKLWQIVKDTLKKIVPATDFPATESKIDGCFVAGYGTVLFFEDQAVVKNLQASFPSYKDKFPVWSEHTSAMHQFVIWTSLADSGLGASLQHYNPLIDDAVRKEWNLNPDWQLTAQMPFGVPAEKPGEKTHEPLENRLKVFR